MDLYDKLKIIVENESDYLCLRKVCIDNIKIEKRVYMNCFHCRNYKKKWTCPPNIPNIDYSELFKEYDNSALLYCKIPFKSKQEFDVVRQDSTNLVHNTLLKLETELYLNNNSLAISFIGGSCKLCKDGCQKDICRFPDKSRIPLEATGVNVLKLVKDTLGIEIVFPPEEYLYRFGMLLW